MKQSATLLAVLLAVIIVPTAYGVVNEYDSKQVASGSTEYNEPFIIDVLSINETYIHANFSYDCSNVTVPAQDIWMNLTNTNNFAMDNVYINTDDNTSDFTLQGNTYYNNFGSSQSCTDFYDTEIVYHDTGPDIEWKMIWGNSTSEVIIKQATQVQIDNDILDINISARGSIVNFRDKSGATTIEWMNTSNLAVTTLGLYTVVRSSNFYFCQLDTGKCSNVNTNNPTTTIIKTGPLLAEVIYLSDAGFGGALTNNTYKMWTGASTVDMFTNLDDGANSATYATNIRGKQANPLTANALNSQQVVSILAPGVGKFKSPNLPPAGSLQLTNLSQPWFNLINEEMSQSFWQYDRAFDLNTNVEKGSDGSHTLCTFNINFANGPDSAEKHNHQLITTRLDSLFCGLQAPIAPTWRNHIRYGVFDNSTGTNLALSTKFFNIVDSTTNYLDAVGSCAEDYSGDTALCQASNNVLRTLVTPNTDIDIMYFTVEGFDPTTTSKILVFNASNGTTPTQDDLLYILVNDTDGTFSFVDDDSGVTPVGCPFNTPLESGTCNIAQVEQEGSSLTFLFALENANNGVELLVQNESISVGFTIETTTFEDGNPTVNVTIPASVNANTPPNVTYTASIMRARGLQGSPFPSNIVIKVAEKTVFTEPGVFNFSVLIDMNVTNLNLWLADHPSGTIPIEITGINGVIELSELSIKGTSTVIIPHCLPTEFLDPITSTCKTGTLFISSVEGDERFTTTFGGTISNFFDTTQPFRWERENVSLPVTVSVDVREDEDDNDNDNDNDNGNDELIVEINETNARRILIDFNILEEVADIDTLEQIFEDIADGIQFDDDVVITVRGEGINDYIFIGVPRPKGVMKDATKLVDGVDFTYDSDTETLTILNLEMSMHTLTFLFASTRAMVTIAQIIAGLGGILLAMTLLMNTEINDPEKIIGNLVKVIIVIFILVQFLGL